MTFFTNCADCRAELGRLDAAHWAEEAPMPTPPAHAARAFHVWLDGLHRLSPDERHRLGELAAATQAGASLAGITVGAAAAVTLLEADAARYDALVGDLVTAGYAAGLRIGAKRAHRLGAGALAAEAELQELVAWFDHEPVGA